MTAKPQNEYELLVAARAKLTPRGAWVKGTERKSATFKEKGSDGWAYCLIGAIRHSDGHLVTPTTNKYVIPVIKDLFGSRSPSGAIQGFNDHGKTDKADVLLVLDTAIERAAKDVGVAVPA